MATLKVADLSQPYQIGMAAQPLLLSLIIAEKNEPAVSITPL
jgi:hypothetical protein